MIILQTKFSSIPVVIENITASAHITYYAHITPCYPIGYIVARMVLTLRTYSVADPECERGGGVSHILAEKRGVSFILFQKCMKMQYFHKEGGGGLCWIRH